MENSVEKSFGAEISKKTRSLDLQSLYRVSKEGEQNQKRGVRDSDERVKKKRKSRKVAALTSFEPVARKKKRRKSLDEGYVDGVSSGSGNADKSLSGLSQKSNSSNGLKSISLSLDDNGNTIHIPKRPRGSVGRKKFDRNHVPKSSDFSGSSDQNAKLNGTHTKFEGNPISKALGPSDSKTSFVDPAVKLNKNLAGKVLSNEVKRKVGVDGFKENRSGKLNSAQPVKEEDVHSVVNNGDASSRKRGSNHRKRRDLAGETVQKIDEPSVDSSVSICHDFHDDDEENLEENAARMLSSRFDPSCTGFSSRSRSSASPSVNGFFVPSGRNFVSGGVNSLIGSDSASADADNRVLRPRKQHKEKGHSRKRRHFYEIHSTNLDAHWVLNRKIKVFWPLDESWYYGLVNDYDPERNLHHIKYDDRDEEWINLQNERFKLLLLPGEVPGKSKPKRSSVGDKKTGERKRDLAMDDDSYVGSYMDSEPIISWLARASRRVKSSPSGALKKQKISTMSSSSGPLPFSDRTGYSHGDVDFSEGDTLEPCSNYALLDRSADGERVEKSLLEGTSRSNDSKLPFVYFRRRFREKGEVCHASGNSSVHGHALGSVTGLASDDSLQMSEEYKFSHECLDLEDLSWSADSTALLKSCLPFIESKQFRFRLCLPLPPLLEYSSKAVCLWLLRALLLLQRGTVMTMWPDVHLEMLFVDNVIGLRFMSFEGCLKQAVAFVFLVLTVFYQPTEQGKFLDLQLPVTSIRFKLSSVHNLRNQHVFAFYSFSKVKYSKWLYLDDKLHRHCLLTKELPLSECTYDNIKALESGNHLPCLSILNREPSSFEDLQKKTIQFNLPKDIPKEFCNLSMSHSSSNSDMKGRKLPLFALSFAAAPTFFISLHLRLLMGHSIACINLHDQDPLCSVEHSENARWPILDDYTQVEYCLESVPDITSGSILGMASKEASCPGLLTCTKAQLRTVEVSVSNDGDCIESSQSFENDRSNVAGTSGLSIEPRSDAVIDQSEKSGSIDLASEQIVTLTRPLVPEDHGSTGRSNAKRYSLNGMSVEIPSLDQDEKSVDVRIPSTQQAPNFACIADDGFVHTPNVTGSRSLWHRSRNSFNSSSIGDFSPSWPDVKTNFIRNGFGNGPKKPRTQVQYTLPFEGFELSSKQKIHNQKSFPYKRIRRSNEKRTSYIFRTSQRNLELLACDANVLITVGDKGWRECGARVILELADRSEWRLAVKLCGTTKYSYKVHNILQPGSSNRYTHAMMWKGGKDWVLEFPDRSQWMLFKEMHEECYNRNIRAASVKNIPIPGVHLIEECDDNISKLPYVCNSPKYFCQVETDVDMALNPSRVLYDMDSDDEQWILKVQKAIDPQGGKCQDIPEELFEKTMDMFEKVAYSQHCDHFTSDEIEELMAGVGPMEIIKVIYEHWQQKRQKKGMPLIRHLQPPLWERYQQQVKQWELSMTKVNIALSSGCQEKVPSIEKPPLFAFCLKPRGLEVSNRGSKQRSQRKFPVSGHGHAALADQDGLHIFGRRLNGLAFGDEKATIPGNSHDSPDVSPLLQPSARVYSPRDVGGPGYFSLSSDGSEWNHHPKLYRDKTKKIGAFLSRNNTQAGASYNQGTIGKRNGVHRWNMEIPEWPSQKHYQLEGSHRHGMIEQLDSKDLHEFRLRDASGAAQHALNMAKLKRERARRLLYRADLAIHKAVVALMTAEAIKASSENSSGDG